MNQPTEVPVDLKALESLEFKVLDKFTFGNDCAPDGILSSFGPTTREAAKTFYDKDGRSLDFDRFIAIARTWRMVRERSGKDFLPLTKALQAGADTFTNETFRHSRILYALRYQFRPKAE